MWQILNTLWVSFRARFMRLWTRVRLWLSLTYWRTKGFSKIRQFFSKLLNVKPRDREDYYPVFRWLISKKLAFALVVALGAVSLCYILVMSPVSAGKGGDKSETAVRSYTYNAIPLKYYDGIVQILAKDKTVAYVGEVAGGYASGSGTLYDEEGHLLYEGEFEQSAFSGQGRLYYPNGAVRYQGAFSKNTFEGQGSSYRENGVVEHAGAYADGARHGPGSLYDAGGNEVFRGGFSRGQLLYSEFLGKTTPETAEIYFGAQSIYSGGGEHCVAMTDIGAVYEAADGSNALDEEWRIRRIYVLADGLQLDGEWVRTVDELSARLGQPAYHGTAWVSLAEAVAINLVDDPKLLGRITMQATSSFDGVFAVGGYDRDATVYIYTYRAGELLYTFYTTGGAEDFALYAVEMA